MPNLSSFISYGKALRKPKNFGIRRFESPNSHPYASTDVVHITPTQSIQSYEEEELDAQLPFQSPPVTSPPPSTDDYISPQLTPVRPSTPPKKLDLELPSDSMSDWIPSHLLDTRMYNGEPDHQSPGAGSSKLPEERMITREGIVGREDEGREDEEVQQDDESVYTDEEGYSSSSNDSHIVANLEAMDASSFVQTRDKPPQGMMPAFKKTAPSPIKIPNPSMHGPKVQVIRSSGGSKGTYSYPSSRPESIHSGEEYSASAVSGTTLARALIGNSFVLSSDERASRYRSGGSVLTRTDSATLPRDENPFLYSPMYGNTPDYHSLVPLPPNADSVYIPPSNPRRLSDSKRKRQSTGSLLLQNESEGDTSLVRSHSIGEPVSSEQSRRISRISEADSSSPSIPDHIASDNGPLPSASDSLYAPSPFLSPNPERLSNVSGVSSNRPISTTSSGKEYDTMLDDYYSTAAPMSPDSAEAPNSGGLIPISMDALHFRPPFSPISEESSSQLSPPAPYRRDSRRNTKGSSGSGSPNGPRGTRTPQQVRLLPIGESSQQNGPSSPEPESASSLLPPPPVFSLFNRQRSGSAPNPIKIVRDSQDLTSYNLISTARPVSSSSSPTSSPEQELYAKQTFPETPHAFSPMWSPGSSPGMPGPTDRGSMDQIVLAVPPTPITAAEPMPALAQHMLARAASGARHSRQPSGIRVRTQHVYTTMAPPPIPPDPEPEDEEESKRKRSYPSWVTQKFPNSDGEPSPSIKSDTLSPSLEDSMDNAQSQPPSFHHHREQDLVGELAVKLEDVPANNSSQTSLTVRGLPPLPPSPSVFGVSSFPIHSPLPPGLPQMGSTTSLLVPAHSDASSQESIHSQSTLPGSAAPSPHPLAPPPASSSQLPSSHPLDNTPPSTGSSAELEMGGAPSIRSMGSPPPYYTLVFDQNQGHDNPTPTTGESEYRGTMSPNSPPSSRADSSRQSTSSIGGRRGRSRPPLPLGPRRPSHVANISYHNGRQRNGSVSSINSNVAGGPTRLRSGSSTTPRSPRFQTPAPKWRGYTMDAAKWTFTSAQLQDIVSRAIRQSAEASAIRLLRLETVDKDIPAELHRLELHRTEIKTRYKAMSRKRTEMLATLASHVDGTLHEDPSASLRIINELRDVSVVLDRLAEDLHSVDEQVSQLTSLRDIHDASALAMAIRKLNASFLKQLAVSDALRSQVLALEAERDDAWQQAEKVANDFDRLNEKVEDVTSSNRSSRVLAMRKSSIRVSKAGLRSTRSSTRSSMSSINRLSSASLSGIKSAFSIEDIPPVPPIPRSRRPNRPGDIRTDLPSTRSFMALSTDGNTPNTETRAMARAHDELCDMLGIGNDFRPRRAQSVIGQTRVQGKEENLGDVSTRSSTSGSRPLSMPDRSGLTEVYQSMSADGTAMLATLGLLSDVE